MANTVLYSAVAAVIASFNGWLVMCPICASTAACAAVAAACAAIADASAAVADACAASATTCASDE